MTTLTSHHPTKIGGSMAILAALCAAVVGIAGGLITGFVSLLGVLILLLGLSLPRPGLISLGSVFLGGSVLVVGMTGASAMLIAIGLIGVILGWDLGHNAASLGRQVGNTAQTGRAEAFHAGGSIAVGVFVTVFGMLVYLSMSAAQPAMAVALFALAGLLFILAIR